MNSNEKKKPKKIKAVQESEEEEEEGEDKVIRFKVVSQCCCKEFSSMKKGVSFSSVVVT